MAFCSRCGAEVTGAFCGGCGAPAAGAATPAAPPAVAPSAGGLADNVAGALCYVLGLITGVLFLVLEPYNRRPAIRFHAFQSILLTALFIAVSIALSILGGILGVFAPFFIHFVMGAFSFILWLVALVVWAMVIIKVWSGTKVVLPVIGPLAERLATSR